VPRSFHPPVDERGQATVWILLLLTTMILGGAAMAVDLGRMYTIQTEIQTVAEASAMAAATRMIGTTNSTVNALVTGLAPLDNTTGNDNRFNLHQNSIIGTTDLAVTVNQDYFNLLTDAQSNSNGGQSGFLAHYVRVDVNVESPAVFVQFLNPTLNAKPQVHAAAIAGISNPLCNVSGSDDIAVTAANSSDTQDYGFIPGNYYTMYLTCSQEAINPAACTAAVRTLPLLTGTTDKIEYTVLNHTPNGTATEVNGQLFEVGATGVNPAGDTTAGTTGTITVTTPDTPMTIQVTGTPVVAAGRDVLCGINVRFGNPVDPTTDVCNNITDVATLAAAYPPDSDTGPVDGTLQDFQNDYQGNARRVITAAVVDASSTLTILNFRQFLIEADSSGPGVVVAGAQATRGEMRVQYIGTPVPVRLGSTAGGCLITKGVGRLVLF
jgi:hypothetical protein